MPDTDRVFLIPLTAAAAALMSTGRRHTPRPRVPCAAPGCDRTADAKGLCHEHYMRDYSAKRKARAGG